jgi:hypothetical protein
VNTLQIRFVFFDVILLIGFGVEVEQGRFIIGQTPIGIENSETSQGLDVCTQPIGGEYVQFRIVIA